MIPLISSTWILRARLFLLLDRMLDKIAGSSLWGAGMNGMPNCSKMAGSEINLNFFSKRGFSTHFLRKSEEQAREKSVQWKLSGLVKCHLNSKLSTPLLLKNSSDFVMVNSFSVNQPINLFSERVVTISKKSMVSICLLKWPEIICSFSVNFSFNIVCKLCASVSTCSYKKLPWCCK